MLLFASCSFDSKHSCQLLRRRNLALVKAVQLLRFERMAIHEAFKVMRHIDVTVATYGAGVFCEVVAMGRPLPAIDGRSTHAFLLPFCHSFSTATYFTLPTASTIAVGTIIMAIDREQVYILTCRHYQLYVHAQICRSASDYPS